MNSNVVIAVVTGEPGTHDENAYLNRTFCQKELKWAWAAEKHVQPVVHINEKSNISNYINMAPEEFRQIGHNEWTELITSDARFWNAACQKLLEQATSKGALPSPAPQQ